MELRRITAALPPNKVIEFKKKVLEKETQQRFVIWALVEKWLQDDIDIDDELKKIEQIAQ